MPARTFIFFALIDLINQFIFVLHIFKAVIQFYKTLYGFGMNGVVHQAILQVIFHNAFKIPNNSEDKQLLLQHKRLHEHFNSHQLIAHRQASYASIFKPQICFPNKMKKN